MHENSISFVNKNNFNPGKITQLSQNIINKIAAGEVIEDPSAVVKELVENSIDAHADEIIIEIIDAGRALIRILDNGCGIEKEFLSLALDRHCTSKLTDDENVDLLEINSLGFRGEALPSIASISKFSLTSKTSSSEYAYNISVVDGNKSTIKKESFNNNCGTLIEVKDIFYSTPARFKFLKSNRVILNSIRNVISNLALANPHIEFKLFVDKKERLFFCKRKDNLEGLKKRISEIINPEFIENSVHFENNYKDFRVYGFASQPNFSRAFADKYYMFVNGRPVTDKLLYAVVRAAYYDILEKSRHPILILFIDIPNSLVDCNVHPSKTEVRFNDTQLLRHVLITTIKDALQSNGFKSSKSMADQTIDRLKSSVNHNSINASELKNHYADRVDKIRSQYFNGNTNNNLFQNNNLNDHAKNNKSFVMNSSYKVPNENIFAHKDAAEIENINSDFYFGAPIAQIFDTFVLTLNNDNFFIIDQHAAHERILYEKLKQIYKNKKIDVQLFLINHDVTLTKDTIETIIENKHIFADIGINFDQFGDHNILIREAPTILKNIDFTKLFEDIASEINELSNKNIEERIDNIYSSIACHYSIRSGRKLKLDEMNALLRQMEETPNFGQCNHGRPTYVKLSKLDFEKLFHRK